MSRLKKKKTIYVYLLIIAVVIIILGFVFNPFFVSKHLSPDGILSKSTKTKIYILESLAVFLGFIIFFYAVAKINKNGYAAKIYSKLERVIYHLGFQPRVLIWAVFILLMIVSGLRILNIYSKSYRATGYEYLWIAQSISSGHGFSFDAPHRWFFVDFSSSYPSDEYFSTAAEEPVYPFLMAFFSKILGQYGKLTVLALQVIALLFTSFMIYHLGRKVFNSRVGILASFTLVMLWPDSRVLAEHVLDPAIFAGLLISLSAYMILWCLDRVSIRRGIILGLILGFSCLTSARILLFIPVSSLLILFSERSITRDAWKTALSIILAAGIVICPWTMRNFLVFGKIIPVRTGFGLIAHQNNPILAATFTSGAYACVESLGPLWKAKDAKEAIRLATQDKEKRIAIYKRSFDCIEQEAPEGYERFNEAERDSVYLKKTLKFIFSEPRTFAILTYHRIILFFFGWKLVRGLVALLALAVAVIMLRSYKARVLTLLVLSFAVPYSLVLWGFYRYRYPIEPILLLLASYVPILIIYIFRGIRRSLSRWLGKSEM